ncbi:hypothetical protein GO755_27960 [Spirosoma sp. HMF4905]|uniref:DUF3872 domain-containing protein n=1 Tax=Spirosoma arboris TaxID=2682092 RepID=A0A7K1SJI6_9BACT|nr:hypothetical protein [Spirosoma arboris]MVM33904.1 hypothetical protein [Spirosoma arboris]
MKNLLSLILIWLAMGCQSESLDIRANYRIRLNATLPGTALKAHQRYALPLVLLTDSYYSEYGYKLQFYQQTGLGRLEQGSINEHTPVLQKVAVNLPLGMSSWVYIPEAVGASQVILIAQQERGYTQPDTLRLNFQVEP